jgi:hypothetical protein
MFVRGVVICDQMKIKLAWRLAINLLKKRRHSTWVMVGLGAGNQLARQLIRGANKVIVPCRT